MGRVFGRAPGALVSAGLGLALLSACAPAPVERLSDVEMPAAAPASPIEEALAAAGATPAVAASPEPLAAQKGGLFSRVLGRRDRGGAEVAGAEAGAETETEAEATDAAGAEAVAKSGAESGAGAEAVAALASETGAAPEVADVTAGPRPRRGLFGLGKARTRVAEGSASAPAEGPEADAAPGEAAPVAGAGAGAAGASVAVAAPQAGEPVLATSQEKPARKGLFAGLRRKGGDSAGAAEGEVAGQAADQPGASGGDEDRRLAALTPETAAPEARPRREKRRGLFAAGPRRIDPDAPDARLAEAGEVLPYGEVARLCGANARGLGKEVARYPERGAQYRLYDTAPASTGARTFLVTGFPDGCARQFTAALAMFGTVGMHEQLRYGLPAKTRPYSATDKAYEGVKRRVCGVGKQKPCGAKLKRLEKDTVFLTVYERFGGNARWSDMLLHDGVLLAKDMKSN